MVGTLRHPAGCGALKANRNPAASPAMQAGLQAAHIGAGNQLRHDHLPAIAAAAALIFGRVVALAP